LAKAKADHLLTTTPLIHSTLYITYPSMPSVIGSPARQYTPPSSNDESLIPTNSLYTQQRTKQHPPSTTNFLPTHIIDPNTMSVSTPASPPSSSEDSPTTSTADTNTFLNDTEMLDYDDYTTHTHTLEESSPEALFFGARNPQISSSRFISVNQSPERYANFTNPLKLGYKGSPEFDADGDSPGLGSDMRGLRLNSRFPSPVQGTVRLEDVMLPNEDPLASYIPSQNISGSLFEKPEVQHVEGFHSYNPFPRC
jgi:hypothetical protein